MLGGESLNYRIENKKAMRVVGVRIPLSYEKDEDMIAVPNFWSTILVSDTYRQLCAMSATEYLYGVTDSTDKNTSYYYICVETKEKTPFNMHELILPVTQRVIFENNGRFKESVQKTFKRFLLEWLPFSHYEYEGSPDIEVYPINAEKNKEGHSEIWIAIKEEKE